MHFSKIINQQYLYGVLFQIDLIISEKCAVTPNFLFGYQEQLLSSAFSAWFWTAQKYPCINKHQP